VGGFSGGAVVPRWDGFARRGRLHASRARLIRVARLVAWLAVALLVGAVGFAVLTTAPSPSIPSAALEREQTSLARLQSLPVQAQSVISTAVGAGAPAFAASPTPAGYRATGGGVIARFAAGGIALSSHTGSVSFSSLALGRGGHLVALAPGSLAAHANRVIYDRGTVAEWYAAGPLGIEQGFTVARRPAGVGRGLTLALGVGGGLRPQQAGSGVRFVTPSGRVAFRYGGLEATDARGRVLPTALALRDGRLLISVTDSRASYPIRIDPFIQQGGPVTPSDEAGPYGYYGSSAAVSADGTTAAVGAEEDGNTQPASTSTIDNDQGAVWVFTQTAGVWHQQGSKLVGNPGGSGAQEFGSSVSLSADGDTVLIGADAGDLATFPVAKTGIGSAYVFSRAGGVWTRQTMIQPVSPTESYGFGIAAGSGFGGQVALSGDGTTALVAGDDGAGDGQFWVFKRSGSSWASWSQQGDLNQPSGVGAHTLTAVALSTDGSTAVVGTEGVGTGVGAAWIYQRSGSSWSQQGPPLAPTNALGSTPFFGLSVALSADGNTALVGAPLDGGNASPSGVTPGPGAAFVFTRAAATWSQQAKLTAAGSVSLGAFVGLTADGNTAVVGGGTAAGVGAYEWTRSGSAWTSQGVSAIPGITDASSAALAGGGTTVVVGDESAGDGVGTAEVFTHVAGQYKLSGTVFNQVCTATSCTRTGVADVTVSVTGTADDGTAVSQSTVSALDGTWSVLAPSGTYTVTPDGDAWTPASLTKTVPPDVSGVDFVQCASSGSDATARLASRGVLRATTGGGCGSITLAPNANIKAGQTITIQGADWNPKKGDVILQLVNPDTGVVKSALGTTGKVDSNGSFTAQFPLDDFTERAVDPHESDGCAVGIRATQGTHSTIAKATSPGMGHVAYAHYGGTAPLKTGDVYCLGEDPAGLAGQKDIVVAMPASSSPPVAGLTAYRIGADPLNINFRGAGGSAPLFVGATLCLSPGARSQSIVVSAANPVGHVGTCPATFPARHDNQGVRNFGRARTQTTANGCLDLAAGAGISQSVGKERVGPLGFVGTVDCKLDPFVGSTLNIARTLFVDGSLRVRAPFVAAAERDIITSGSFDAATGISVSGSSRAIVGGNATFGIGPPTRGFSDDQKRELRLMADQMNSTGTLATHTGSGLATVGLAAAKFAPPPAKGPGLAVAATGALLSYTSSFGTIAANAITVMAADPPDRAYRNVARAAAVGAPPVIRSGKGLSRAKARILNKLLRSFRQQIQIERALQTAVNRAGGAAQAGNVSAEGTQIAAAVSDALKDAKLLDARPKLLADAARVLRSLRPGRYRPTKKVLAAFRSALKRHGFSARYVAQERAVGITAQQLRLYRLVLINDLHPARLSAAQIIGAPALASAARKEAALLRVFAAAAPSTVGLREGLAGSL
jgi:FG-GAP repeat